MSLYEIYNVEFSSARIHIKKARNNANPYFDESYYPLNYCHPHLINWFKAKPTYLHLLAPLMYRFDVKYQPLLLNKPPATWKKIEKSSKTGQEKKSLSTFACFWIAIAKV